MITFCSYRKSLREVGRSCQIILFAVLLDDHSLNVFKKLVNLPSMWRKLGSFLPFVILVWSTSPPSAYSGTMMSGRKLDNGEKKSFHFLSTGCFSCCEKGKDIVEDHYLDKQILLQDFSSIRTMIQKSFLLKCKFSLLNIFQ